MKPLIVQFLIQIKKIWRFYYCIKMNKLITIICYSALIFLNSCDNKSMNEEVKNLKIENYLDSLQTIYKGYKENSVIKEELNTTIKKNFGNKINDGILNDLPFKLIETKKCYDHYILDLEFSQYDNYFDSFSLNYKRILNKLKIKIIAETDERTAKSLSEGLFYLIEINFKEYLTFENKSKSCIELLWSPYEGYLDNEIEFGAINAKLKKIEKIEKVKNQSN
jgi:hypothetical protein